MEKRKKIEICELKKALNSLGIKLSEAELIQLKSGYRISLEHQRLGEIGLIFILAEANLRKNSVKLKNVTFNALRETAKKIAKYSDIPIYFWLTETDNSCCLLLSLENNKPEIRVSPSLKESSNEIFTLDECIL